MSTSRYNIDTKGTELVNEFASSIAGKTVLITGVSPNSLGAFFVETISALKNGPKLLILAGRNRVKLQETQEKVQSVNAAVETRALVVDLQSFVSVRKAAEEVLAQKEPIDIVINNAGIMAPPYSKTPDGFESAFQSNHLSHFLFANLIMDKLLAAPEPRIVVVSSDGYRLGHVRYHDYNFHVRQVDCSSSANTTSDLCFTAFRMARHTTPGPHTANPRAPTISSPANSPPALDPRVLPPSPYTQESSSATSAPTSTTSCSLASKSTIDASAHHRDGPVLRSLALIKVSLRMCLLRLRRR